MFGIFSYIGWLLGGLSKVRLREVYESDKNDHIKETLIEEQSIAHNLESVAQNMTVTQDEGALNHKNTEQVFELSQEKPKREDVKFPLNDQLPQDDKRNLSSDVMVDNLKDENSSGELNSHSSSLETINNNTGHLKPVFEKQSVSDYSNMDGDSLEHLVKAVDVSIAPLKLLDPKGRPDDLKAITGIGPVNERELHELGIFHYWQIAQWTPENILWISEHIRFPNRIFRENWMKQASELMKNSL